MLPALRARRSRAARRAARLGGLERHRRPAPGVRARGRRAGRRGRHHAVSASSPRPTACSTRTPGPVFCDIDPRTLNIDPAAAAAAVTERTTGPAAGAHLRLPRRHAGVRGARAASAGSGSSRTRARRSARVHGDGRAGRRARATSPCSRFYPNKQMTTGEGGCVVSADAEQGADRLASATRAARRTWAGSTTTGSASTTGSPTSPCALGVAQLERLDELLDGARARGRPLQRGAGGRRGARAAMPRRGRRPPQLVRLRGAAAGRRRSRRGDRALRERGVDSKPYLPAIHLMSFYRERFGHREGEFPVCEDVARRSLALPFFPRAQRGPGGARGGRAARGRAGAQLGR